MFLFLWVYFLVFYKFSCFLIKLCVVWRENEDFVKNDKVWMNWLKYGMDLILLIDKFSLYDMNSWYV